MTHPVITIETAVFAVLLAAGLWGGNRRRAWAENALGRALHFGIPGEAAAFVLTFALAALLSWARPPLPSIHDELSYQLAAETFAAGRLTNPPHPMWRHFETFHVLHQPTYQSRYPPGQGLAMAVGIVAAGSPIAGVWLSAAAAAAALYWALRFWLPARWALCAALLPIVRFGGLAAWDLPLYAYWSTTYWGGSLALMGGALVFGGAARLWREPRAADGFWMAAGLAVLACTRPYEGLWLGAPLTCMALWGCARRKAWKPAAAGAAVLAAGGAFLAVCNATVTGAASRFPYSEYARQYDLIPALRFQPLKAAPAYRHPVVQRYFLDYRVDDFERQRSGWGLDRTDIERNVRFFFGLLLAPVFLLGFLWRSHWMAFSAAVLMAGLASHLVASAGNLRPHYFAPFAPALLLLTVQGLRGIGACRIGRIGRPAAQAILATLLIGWAAAAALRVTIYAAYPTLFEKKRAVAARLAPADGRHLVLVRYSPEHLVHEEWVYNAADIDRSPIVWARSMSPAEDRELVEYYRDRIAWSLWADENPPRIEPYSEAGSVVRPSATE